MNFARPYFAALAFVAGGGAVAAPVPRPPLTGEVTGVFRVAENPQLPAITWRLEVDATGASAPRGELTATAPGLRAKVAVTLPQDGTRGTWRVTEAEIVIAEWWRPAALSATVAVPVSDLQLAGTLRATGAGEWDERGWGGAVRAEITAASAASALQGWSAGEISVSAELAGQGGKFFVHAARLRAGEVRAAGLVAREVRAEITGEPDGRLRVTRAECEVLGGRVALAEFSVDPAAPAVRTVAEFFAISLAELAPLLPPAIAAASGRMSGRIDVGWSPKNGLELREGALRLVPGEAASLRVRTAPGTLSGSLPAKLDLFPKWLLPLVRGGAPGNPSYLALAAIERGEQALAVESLDVALYPPGDPRGRSAVVRVVARPRADSAVRRVDFEVGVTGPLAEVVRLGLNREFSVSVRQ